jgi:tetratricopeptide (TPR) repeat protein
MGKLGRSSRWVALAIALAVSGTFSARAWADASADIDAGEAAYAGLDYEKANSLAQKAVGQRGLSHDQVVRAYRLLGRTYAVLGKSQQAIDAFEKLLTYAPDERADP